MDAELPGQDAQHWGDMRGFWRYPWRGIESRDLGKLEVGLVPGIPVPRVFLAERGVANRPGSGVHLGCGLRGPSGFVLLGRCGRVPLG